MKRVAGPRLLRAYLDRYGLKQNQAALDLGVSAPTVHDWLKGTKRPREAFRQAMEKWTSGEVPASSWIPVSPRKAKRRRGGSGGSPPPSPVAPRAPRAPRGRAPRGRPAAAAEAVAHRARETTEAELLAAMAPELLADAGDRCRVCGCFDAAPCPGGCSWVPGGLCSTCAALLEQLVQRVPRSGRREEELLKEVAEAFDEQLEGAAAVHARRALQDLVRRGVLRREGGRLWRSPPVTSSRRARPAQRGAEAAP